MMKARVNGQIKANEVRVISEDGAEIGVLTIDEALKLAASRRQDLVEIEPDSKPPVCQAIDYGRYRYRLQEEEKRRRGLPGP